MSWDNVMLFARMVREEMLRDDLEPKDVNRVIEDAYDLHISRNDVPKSDFLKELVSIDEEVHAATVTHLFTPINWSRVKMHKLWGLKNSSTGNLVSLTISDDDDGVFILRDGKDDVGMSPMTTRDHDSLMKFLKIVQQMPVDENVPMATEEVIVHLEFGERVNPMNLEIVEVKVIF